MANRNLKGDVNVEFTEATSRQGLDSGESVKTLFGKVRKWLSDLKPVAFSGSYNDLSDKPTIDNTPVYIECTAANFNEAVSLLRSGKAVFGTLYKSSIYYTFALSYNSKSSSKTIYGMALTGYSVDKMVLTTIDWTSSDCKTNTVYVTYSLW